MRMRMVSGEETVPYGAPALVDITSDCLLSNLTY